jgi:hypothetical protein
MTKKLIFAVDFDGTLCSYAFPKIGEQHEHHKELMDILISLRKDGHKLILWTNRGDNEQYKSLTEAIEWCRERGLEFDEVNKNVPEKELAKLSGYSPKIMADYYIDDKALSFNSSESAMTVLNLLKNL